MPFGATSATGWPPWSKPIAPTLVFVNTRRLASGFPLPGGATGIWATMLWQRTTEVCREIRLLSAEDRLKTGPCAWLWRPSFGAWHRCRHSRSRLLLSDRFAPFHRDLSATHRPGRALDSCDPQRPALCPRDELIRMCRVNPGVRGGVLDCIGVPPAPLDVLAQQIVAAARVAVLG